MPRSLSRPPDSNRNTAAEALSDTDIESLQAALDALPAPLEPLDVSALDGFLAAIVVQPRRVALSRWLPFVLDADLSPRPAPAGTDASRIAELAGRREAELRREVDARRWFDPWLYALDFPQAAPSQIVLPWVAGFAFGFDAFPDLAERGGASLDEALALVYRHLDADDLEDAEDLLALIDELEPVASVEEAVEDLVRATLLLADVATALRREPHPRRATPRAHRR